MDKNGQRVACKNLNVYSPQRQNNLIFFWLPYSGLGKAVAGINPGSAMQLDALAFLPHPTDITDIASRNFAFPRKTFWFSCKDICIFSQNQLSSDKLPVYFTACSGYSSVCSQWSCS